MSLSADVEESSNERKMRTTATTRKWSDLDPVKLLSTVGVTTAAATVASQPLYVILARQQCANSTMSFVAVARDVYHQHGMRGYFRGCGATVGGMVLFSVLYYVILELSKEHLPLESKASRDFMGGLLADGTMNPVYAPFAVVSQLQMVAGFGVNEKHPYHSALRTTKDVVAQRGYKGLFRGLVLSMVMLPLAGAWWIVYEQFKQLTYDAVEGPEPFRLGGYGSRLPSWCTSRTDNALLNLGIGAGSSAVVMFLANPLYVIRTRVQVMAIPHDKWATAWVAKELWRTNGIRGMFQGLFTNVMMGAAEGSVFALTYEGTKLFADKSGSV